MLQGLTREDGLQPRQTPRGSAVEGEWGRGWKPGTSLQARLFEGRPRRRARAAPGAWADRLSNGPRSPKLGGLVLAGNRRRRGVRSLATILVARLDLNRSAARLQGQGVEGRAERCDVGPGFEQRDGIPKLAVKLL